MKEEKSLTELNLVYVGERSLWRYKSSGWGLIIPRKDGELLKIDKNTVARVYVSYENRMLVLKLVDLRAADPGKTAEELLK